MSPGLRTPQLPATHAGVGDSWQNAMESMLRGPRVGTASWVSTLDRGPRSIDSIALDGRDQRAHSLVRATLMVISQGSSLNAVAALYQAIVEAFDGE